MKLFLLLFLIMAQTWANTELSSEPDELPYLFIPPVEVPKEFSEFEKQQVNKIVIRGTTKQTTYQVVIGTPDVSKKFKWGVFKVSVLVYKIDDEFKVVADLRDARKEKMVNHIEEDHIPVLDFYRRLEEIINRLFRTPENVTDGDEKPKPPKIKAQILPVPVPEAKQANINFRERIMDLKSNVNEAVAKAGAQRNEKKNNDASKSSDEDQNSKKNQNAKPGDGSDLLQVENAILPKPPGPTPPIDTGHSMRMGYYTFTTHSTDNKLDTDSNPKYLLVDYEFARAWTMVDDMYHHFNIRYGKTLNKEEKEFAPYQGWAILEGYHFRRYNWMPKAGLEMDTISFKNLPVAYHGLQIANNQIVWANLSSVNEFTVFNRRFRLSLGYGHPVKVMSNYKGLNENPSLAGSKMNVTFAYLNLYSNYHLELNYFQSQIQATAERVIKFDTRGVGLNAFYNF